MNHRLDRFKKLTSQEWGELRNARAARSGTPAMLLGKFRPPTIATTNVRAAAWWILMETRQDRPPALIVGIVIMVLSIVVKVWKLLGSG